MFRSELCRGCRSTRTDVFKLSLCSASVWVAPAANEQAARPLLECRTTSIIKEDDGLSLVLHGSQPIGTHPRCLQFLNQHRCDVVAHVGVCDAEATSARSWCSTASRKTSPTHVLPAPFDLIREPTEKQGFSHELNQTSRSASGASQRMLTFGPLQPLKLQIAAIEGLGADPANYFILRQTILRLRHSVLQCRRPQARTELLGNCHDLQGTEAPASLGTDDGKYPWCLQGLLSLSLSSVGRTDVVAQYQHLTAVEVPRDLHLSRSFGTHESRTAPCSLILRLNRSADFHQTAANTDTL
mmetsp:Transcript_59598/g.158574  ORF Transcript_59598/g.158574 Transcript_59598/m.158574 type:complete len:298 (-) Transcript_59598:1532-2425(-)